MTGAAVVAVTGSGPLAAALNGWAPDPALAVPLLWIMLLYLAGLARAWRRAGTGNAIPVFRAGAGLLALIALAAALASPLEPLAGLLFSAHMAQHLLLVLVVAPLLAVSLPALTVLWALPPVWRRAAARLWLRSGARAVWRTATHPVLAWFAFVGVLWLWHVPVLYQAAVSSPALHALEHFTLTAAAVPFWWAALGPLRAPRLPRTGVALLLFVTALQGSLLGVLITLSPTPWYPLYAASAERVGVGALFDQQLAGLLMWVPPGLLYLALAAWSLLKGLREIDEHSARGVHPRPATPRVDPRKEAPLP